MPTTNHWHRETREKICIMCGELLPLGDFYAYRYITNQGKESTRYNSRCKACSRQRRRERYAENPERHLMINRAWKAANDSRVKAYAKNRQENDMEFRAIKATAQRRRKARMRADAGSPRGDTKEIRDIYRRAGEITRETGIQHHVDHIIPLSRGGKHEIGNLQILTATENLQKGARPTPPCHHRGAHDA